MFFTFIVKAEDLVLQPDARALWLKDIEVLAGNEMTGRKPGTEGHEKAKNYIVSRYQQIGLKTFRQGFEHTFPLNNKQVTGKNLIAWLPGQTHENQYIVFTAHYDHLGKRGRHIYNGADDNASGVAGMLAVAEFFAANSANFSLIFVATDVEEDGLYGAKAFLENPPVAKVSIMMNVNLDMISNGGRRKSLYVAGSRAQPLLKQIIKTAKGIVNTKNLRLKAGHDNKMARFNDGGIRRINWQQASDHGPFIKQGIPYLYFGVDVHKHYHRGTDDFQHLHQKFFVDAVRAILYVTRAVDNAPLQQLIRQ